AQEAGISLKSKKPLRPPKSVVEKDHQQSDEPMLIHNIEEIAPDKRTLVKKKESKKLKAVQMKQQTPPVQKSGPGKSTAGAASGVQTVRVAIGKLDSLMNLVGELLFNKLRMDQKVVNINGLQEWFSELQTRLLKIQNVFEAFNGDDEESAEIMKELMAGNVESLKVFLQEVRNIGEQFAHLDGEFSDLVLELSEGMGRLSTVTSDLQEGIMKTRMLPISTVFDKFPRLVRDLSRNSSKEVILDIAGGDTELDKTVLEKVSDPLIHLIRNTVDHGIETQEEREVLNKPRAGHVWLKAEQCGDIVVIEIADDGRGIDHERIAAVAIEKGILTPDEAHRRQPWELRNLIFSPGFSTKETVTEVSGRGVGCDVVKRNIEGLKGIIELESEVNMGSTFRIKLPLTLAIIQGLVIRCWDERYVIPLSSVVESLKMSPDMVIAIGGKEAVRVRDEVLPFIRLDKVLEVPGGISEEEENFLVIVASAEKRLGFSVHELIGKQEIVIKTLGSLLKHVNNIAGSTIMGDGRVLLIMDVAALVQQGFAWIRDVTALDNERPVFEEKGKIILVVDDSPTIRSIERHLLESEGYQVVTAENGEKGIEAARRVAPALVISDVEMPVMNGYEMVKAIRADETLKKLPIVMVTTRSSEEDRIKGLRAGANEYLGKPFEQQALLKTIKRFLG
ncbi:MAG: hybrid sensor histidine kinase/response regulator, partial [bacterium]|nr:hybrid sensor histidine kinase/response regulator [bacterium]